MGYTKTDLYRQHTIDLAGYASALAHPARIKILRLILRNPGYICTSIQKEIGLSQPTISQHLKVLRNAGLIKGEISGTKLCYCLHEANWAKMKKSLGQFLEI